MQTYSIAIRLNTNGLIIEKTGVFAAVLVGEVHGVAGELHAARLRAFDEVGVVFACYNHIDLS